MGDGVGLGSVTWVACGLVWGIGLRRLGCGCGRRLVTGSCVYLRDDPDGSSAVLAARFSIYLSIYLSGPARVGRARPSSSSPVFTSRDGYRLGGAEQGARGGVVGDHAVASEEEAAGAHASRTNQGGGSRPRTRSMSSPLAASLAAALRVQTVSCP